MTGYELTREDVENIALANRAIAQMEKRFDKIESLLSNDNRRCTDCRKEISAEVLKVSEKVDTEVDNLSTKVDTEIGKVNADIQKIVNDRSYEKGLTKGQAVAYGSIPSCAVALLGIAYEVYTHLPK